jgi:hypothetical protein
MIDFFQLLLALNDGAAVAKREGDEALSAALTAITDTLAEGSRHMNDLKTWREDDIKAIFDRTRK